MPAAGLVRGAAAVLDEKAVVLIFIFIIEEGRLEELSQIRWYREVPCEHDPVLADPAGAVPQELLVLLRAGVTGFLGVRREAQPLFGGVLLVDGEAELFHMAGGCLLAAFGEVPIKLPLPLVALPRDLRRFPRQLLPLVLDLWGDKHGRKNA